MISLKGYSQIMRGDEVIEVIRHDSYTFENGRLIESGPHEFEVKANVQTVSGQELLLVPEGDRYKEQFFLFIQKPSPFLKMNDEVKRHKKNYQVQDLEEWGSFQKVRIMNVDVSDEAHN